MLLGSFAAIGQTNIKRLMAYSSIGHVGFALVGLAAGTEDGVVRRAGLHGDLHVHDHRHVRLHPLHAPARPRGRGRSTISPGSARTQPLLAAALAIFMFSMAGIPPLAGFFAKLYVFFAAIQADLVPLAVIGVLASVVGAYYYIRIVKVMYFDEPRGGVRPADRARDRGHRRRHRVFNMVFCLLPSPLLHQAEAAAAALLS